MPGIDIDPAALSRPDVIATATPASLSLSKATGGPPPLTTKTAKASNTVQRIDLEPLYTSLKSTIGDNWGRYKQALSLFMLGGLNQEELSYEINFFVISDPSVEHLHNQLIAGIYGNVCRDPPEPGVAPWVSANDKPTVVSKPLSGDAAEQRLKTEVMQLPGKDRRRLKIISERDPNDEFMVMARNESRAARNIRVPDHIPISAGGLNKTNWEMEIKKRYTQPLASETGEFPDTDSIQARMLPICYEEALPNGCASSCAEFMATATEQYLKEVIGEMTSRTRSNIIAGGVGGGTVLTRKYKKQLHRETQMFEEGKLQKAPMSNLLPVELREAQQRRVLGIGDMRIALELGPRSLGQMPEVVSTVMGGYPEGVLEGWGRHGYLDPELKLNGVNGSSRMAPPLTNGNGSLTNGVHVNGVHGNTSTSEGHNDMPGWQGTGGDDQKQLRCALDDCLNFGSY